MELSDELWKDSQEHELRFWRKEYQIGNTDQRKRNIYYLSNMEGQCSLIKDYISGVDVEEKIIMDLGSGPEGILHVLKGKRKVAIDPLMGEFKAMGYKINANDVITYTLRAEEIGEAFEENFDLIFCLNSIDHHQNPELVIHNIYKALKKGGDLILLTDTRLESECDQYHKLPLTAIDILDWTHDVNFQLINAQIFPHGAGNPIMQFIIHSKK